jgi:FkbM family methyltransferase
MSRLGLLKWLPNFIKAFGPRHGLRLFLHAAWLLGRGGEDAVPLRLPGLPRPVWIRPGLHDLPILLQVFVKGEYDMRHTRQFEHVEAVYRRRLADGQCPLIIDCGAHVGLAGLWFRAAFPEAHLFCVEPSPANFAILQRNLGGLPGVTLFHGGISGRPGRLRLTNMEGGMAGFRLAPGGAGGHDEVAAITIDDILARTGAPGALVVKVDIEGGEAALFEGEAGWLDDLELLAIELHDWLYPWQGTSDTFFAQIGRRRLDHLFRGENLFCFRRPPAGEAPGIDR